MTTDSNPPLWRHESHEWNGQRPKSSRPIYLHPAPAREPDTVRAEALRLLAVLFNAYENGPACHDGNDDEEGAFIGNAVRLSDEDFTACADLLNAHVPRSQDERKGEA